MPLQNLELNYPIKSKYFLEIFQHLALLPTEEFSKITNTFTDNLEIPAILCMESMLQKDGKAAISFLQGMVVMLYVMQQQTKETFQK